MIAWAYGGPGDQIILETLRLQNSCFRSFRKARSAVSVILECEARMDAPSLTVARVRKNTTVLQSTKPSKYEKAFGGKCSLTKTFEISSHMLGLKVNVPRSCFFFLR